LEFTDKSDSNDSQLRSEIFWDFESNSN
jgi:hypothetical protein